VAATPSIKITKSFAYDGGTRLWSNRYHFNGGTPADNTAWTTLADAIIAEEKVIFHSDVTIVEATGYEAGSDVPVFSYGVSVAGTGSFVDGTRAPGDVAALLRYATTARSSKNHPVYLFNYFHGVWVRNLTGHQDELDLDQASAIEEYGDDWVAGFSDGTNTLVRAGPNGATAGARHVPVYVTHRDFPH
jgi:hypothetical protein